MKKFLLLWVLGLALLAWCANNKEEIELLKEQNTLLKQQLHNSKEELEKPNQEINKAQNVQEIISEKQKESKGQENKPDVVKLTVSRMWWALSRQVQVVWDISYKNEWWWESYPINSNEIAEEYIGWRFNGWWYLLQATCNEWYTMMKCWAFSKSDSVTIDTTTDACQLWNEDPNLMRTSMIIECHKN